MLDVERDDVVVVVEKAVETLLEEAGVAGPPIDAIGLARRMGIEVCLDPRQAQRGRAQRSAGVRQIYLRPEPTIERHQWTVAHEIGEHLKPSLLADLGVSPDNARAMSGEALANLFAFHLLAPTCWLASDGPDWGYDLLELKRRYTTASHEVIAWRLLDLPEPCIITLVDNNRIHRRRSNRWPVRKELAAPELKCQQHVYLFGIPQVVREEGWSVQGWPIHRDGWKREILRSVVETD